MGTTCDAGLLEAALVPAHRMSSAELADAPAVPGFEIISRLGTGSSGEVWLADELQTGRIVALKILHRSADSGASRELLQREFRIMAELIHPNLVLLYYGVVTADGRHGLAMEWIDGWPLDEWLQRHPELSPTDKLELFRGIVRGVAFLHDHGVIHRDLKPANVIVDAEGLPKIVDFSLAHLHRQDAASGNDGGSAGVSGTLHFMAPEQAANRPGSRAMPVDVYALGLMLHRILTGNWLRPVGNTPDETLALVLNPPPLALRGAERRLPRDLQSILRQALAPDPAHRYHHARELEADLKRFSTNLPVAARKHTFLYLGATLLRRQARRSLIAGVLVLAGLGAGVMIHHRHRMVAERNDANLRYAYTLTSFTLGKLRDELRSTSAEWEGGAGMRTLLPGMADGAMPPLPVDGVGELDLRYYHAVLADLRSASLEGHALHVAALDSIQTALNLYSELALESPGDPLRLLDAAQARLSFARLLDRTGRTGFAGGEARKVIGQLKRLEVWQGFDPSPLPPLHCDALRLLAREADQEGASGRAFGLGLEALAACRALPPGLLARPENEALPRLALAAGDLATYAIAAGPQTFPQARLEITSAAAVCREVHAREPRSGPHARVLANCLHALVRLHFHEGSNLNLQALFEEAADLLIDSPTSVDHAALPLVHDLSIAATAWAGRLLYHPEFEVSDAALGLATRFTTHARRNGIGSDQLVVQRARIFLYRSRLVLRFEDRKKAVLPASRAIALLIQPQHRAPDDASLALLTAAALYQARSFADLPASSWNGTHAALLDRLLFDLATHADKLSPEQQRELASYQ